MTPDWVCRKCGQIMFINYAALKFHGPITECGYCGLKRESNQKD
jgi:hypothetical protein